jgi:tetratricopeptide (TPR) repeat protein
MLIQEIVRGEKPDSRKLLAQVDKQQVVNSIRKSKSGLPKPINFTDEPMEEENFAKLPHKVKRRLWRIYGKLTTSPREQLPELLKLRAKYPNVPAIYNYLSICYANSGQNDKFYDTVRETLEKFPDYLFGKISFAEYYLNKGDYKKIPEILEGKLELHQHYPKDVNLFHISEVRSFYSVVGCYYARANKIARALLYYFLLEEIDPEHYATQRLGNEIISIEIKKIRQRIKANLGSRKRIQ